MALDNFKTPAGGLGEVRVEEGYLVNATINAQGQLEGKLAPSFNRYEKGMHARVVCCVLCARRD